MTELNSESSEAELMAGLVDGDSDVEALVAANDDTDEAPVKSELEIAAANPEDDAGAPAAVDPAPAVDVADAPEGDPEIIEWGEGEDVKSATLDQLIERFEAEPDFEQAPQVQERVQALNAEQLKISERFVQEVTQTREARAAFMDKMSAEFSFMPEPAMPDQSLITQDPMAYNRQLATYQAEQNKRNQVIEQYRQLTAAQEADAKRVAEAEAFQQEQYINTEKRALQTAWPEFAQPETQTALTEMVGAYGMTAADLGEIQDHRAFLILRDLLNVRAAQKQAGDTVAKLKAKTAPRRVRPRQTGRAQVSATASLNAKMAGGGVPTEAEAMAALTEAI